MDCTTLSVDSFSLNPDESAFYQEHTGIHDEDKLKAHIMEVAERSLKVYPYHCIAAFGFLRFRILRSKPGYKQLLKLGSTRSNALFLDLGCCFGNDIRKAIQDGFPAQNIIASDLQADFWRFGHELFNTTPSTFPVAFIAGDVLDPSFISIQPPLQEPPSDTASISLQALVQAEPKSLNPLRGHLSAIHTSAFFHLFNRDEQVVIGKKLAALLSPLPGSVIFGSHLGSEQPPEEAKNGTGTTFYRHSPESWKKMWEEEIFDEKGIILVEAGLGGGSEFEQDTTAMWWVVMRV